MKDDTATVADLRQAVAAFIEEREWEQFHHPRDLAVSISLEAAELLEHFQWEGKRPLSAIRKDANLVEEVSDELSDILHYVLTFANVLEIDMVKAFMAKMAKNEEKYPADLARGKALKYDRLRREEALTDDEI